jgi:hypothetical protein
LNWAIVRVSNPSGWPVLASQRPSESTASRYAPMAYLMRTGRHNGPVLTAGHRALQSATDQHNVKVPGEDVAPALQQSGKSATCNAPPAATASSNRSSTSLRFCALQRDPVSRAYYDRKRREGKTHQLARRRIAHQAEEAFAGRSAKASSL